jgi:hypothetical protein
LINTERFQSLAASMKSVKPNIDKTNGNYCIEKYTLLKDPDWPEWCEFERLGYNVQSLSLSVNTQRKIQEFYPWQNLNNVLLFDMDSNIFDSAKFMSAISNLYNKLGLDDFNQARMEVFYNAYMELHR